MMRSKQFLLCLLIGAFSLHLAHQLFPHHHHEEKVVASHSHEPGRKHHHHHTSSETNKDKQTDWLDELLSFINHGKIDNPIQSGKQFKTDFCKTIPAILPVFNRTQDFSLSRYFLILPAYSPPEVQPTVHHILFKSRRGPPAMA